MPTRQEREKTARKRLINILHAQTLCLGRTLEQKISDAGPLNQRIDPHILTPTRNELVSEGRIIRLEQGSTPWYHLHDAEPQKVEERLAELKSIHDAITQQQFTTRVGQALEIAVFLATRKYPDLEYVGRFHDLNDHDDSRLYTKEEPPSSIGGHEIPGSKKLDFAFRHPTAGWAGIEVKNIRPWLYPHRIETLHLLQKCLYLNAVPVLIARRIPYVTRRILQACGGLVWQTYNQRYPSADADLADLAKNKNLLGYHDIRLGNEPDQHLEKFLGTIVPNELPRVRERFDEYKDLLADFAINGMDYKEFAARVRRREQGLNEDHDWPYEPDEEIPYGPEDW